MISGLPRPAITGSASCAPASASLRISGSGLISLFIGMKPETIVPGVNATGNGARRDRLGGGRALAGRQRIAPRQRGGAQSGFGSDPAGWNQTLQKQKCGAAMAVGGPIPGTYRSRWAPYVRTHEPGQGQLPLGS